MHALRIPLVASSGALVTLSVFTLLWHFVSVPIEVGEALPVVKIDWTRQRVETPTEVKRVEKTVRPTPPPLPNPPRVTGGSGVDPPTMIRPASVELVALQRPSGVPMRPDGDVIPVVRPAPDYPPRAITNGIEGWVQVRFTVTTIGTVRDAVVVNSAPQKLFDDAALKAIARWRYNPRVESGVAVERVGLQTIIRFELDR